MTTEVKENGDIQDFKSLLTKYPEIFMNLNSTDVHKHIVMHIRGNDLDRDKLDNLVLVPDTNQKGKFNKNVKVLQGETPQDFGELKTTVDGKGLDAAISMAESLGYSIVAVPTITNGGVGEMEDYIKYDIYATPNMQQAENKNNKFSDAITNSVSTMLVNNLGGRPMERLVEIIKGGNDTVNFTGCSEMFMYNVENHIQSTPTTDITITDILPKLQEWQKQQEKLTIIQEEHNERTYYYNCNIVENGTTVGISDSKGQVYNRAIDINSDLQLSLKLNQMTENPLKQGRSRSVTKGNTIRTTNPHDPTVTIRPGNLLLVDGKTYRVTQ